MVKVIVARFELEKTLLKKNMTDQCRWKAQKDRHDHVDLYLGHWRHFGAGLAKASEQLWVWPWGAYQKPGSGSKPTWCWRGCLFFGPTKWYIYIYKWRKWRFFLACILSALKFCRVPQKNWQTKLMFHWFLELTHVCCLSLPIWMMNVHWWWMCVGDESALANDWPFQCLLPHVCWHLHDIPQPLPWPLLGLGWRWVTTKQLLSLLRCRRREAWFARSSVESQGHERTGLAWGLTAAGFLMFLYVFVSICDLFISISCLSIHIYPSIHPSTVYL